MVLRSQKLLPQGTAANQIVKFDGTSWVLGTVGSGSTPHTHPAGDVLGATFGAGNFRFPGTLTVDGTLTQTGVATFAAVPVFSAGIPESVVTAHEAALTILETQITDGSLLARVAAAEAITGAWTFSHATAPIKIDKILERTGAAGVTIDGLLIKDSGIPQAAVTAHEAALAILMSQVTGDLLASRIDAGTFGAGAYTFPGALTISDLFTMTPAISQIKPGATSFNVSNNADTAFNLTITDLGAGTFRAGLQWGGGAAIASSDDVVAVPIPASDVSAGTFAAGNFAFPSDLVIGTDPAGTGILRVGGVARFQGGADNDVLTLLATSTLCDLNFKDSGTTEGQVRVRSQSNAMKLIAGGTVRLTIQSDGDVEFAEEISLLNGKLMFLHTPTDTNWTFGKTTGHDIILRGGGSGTRAWIFEDMPGNTTRFSIVMATGVTSFPTGHVVVGTLNASETLLGITANTSGHEGISMHHDGAGGFITCVDSGTAWHVITFIADSFIFQANGGTEAIQITVGGDIKYTSVPSAGASQDIQINSSSLIIFRITSARAYKNHIVDLEIDSQCIYDLRLRSFTWNNKTMDAGLRDFGLIADEVHAVCPQLVNLEGTRSGDLALGEPLSIRSQPLQYLMLAEIQQLRRELDLLQQDNAQ